MPNGDANSRDLWIVVNEIRENVAEMKGLLQAHLSDSAIHTRPPCEHVVDMQKTILSTAGAAILALLAAVGSLVLVLWKG